MDLRIKELAEKRGVKLYQIADAIGMDQGGFSRMVNGTRRTNSDVLTAVAKYLSVSIGELFETPKIPVVGYIGAGAVVIPIDDYEKGDAFDHIEPDGYYSPNAVAVIVRGESMYDRYRDGDVLIYDEQRTDIESFIGRRECVVKLADDRIMIKRVTRGSEDGLYTLISFNHPPIEDVALQWCARIRSTILRD
jgi:phage repressor protein C with HTH and peptisase S24 domain